MLLTLNVYLHGAGLADGHIGQQRRAAELVVGQIGVGLALAVSMILVAVGRL